MEQHKAITASSARWGNTDFGNSLISVEYIQESVGCNELHSSHGMRWEECELNQEESCLRWNSGAQKGAEDGLGKAPPVMRCFILLGYFAGAGYCHPTPK